MLFENLPSRYWSVSQRLPVDCVQLPLTLAKTLYTGVEFDNLALDGTDLTEEDVTITEGDDDPVTVDVDNVGDVEGTFTVTLLIDEDLDTGDNEDQAVFETAEVQNLGPDEGSEEVEFTEVTDDLDVADDYDVEVSTEDDDILAENTLDVEAEVDSVTPEIDGEQEPDVTIDADNQIDVDVEDTLGDAVEDEDVSVDTIEDGGDDVTVNGLAETDSANTGGDGTAEFADVSFEGDAQDTVDITFSAEDGTEGVLEVTLEN